MAVLHQELLLDLNADCVEFCPSPDQPDLLAVGTYQLDEATNTRVGQLYLYGLQGLAADETLRLHLAGTASVAGIFDVKWWRAQHHRWQIALALADGSLSVLQQMVSLAHVRLLSGSTTMITRDGVVWRLMCRKRLQARCRRRSC